MVLYRIYKVTNRDGNNDNQSNYDFVFPLLQNEYIFLTTDGRIDLIIEMFSLFKNGVGKKCEQSYPVSVGITAAINFNIFLEINASFFCFFSAIFRSEAPL